MPRKAIVNCAVEGGPYPALQARVLAACQTYGGDAELMFMEYPDGCPSHKEKQYAFKSFGIEVAVNLGFRRILWIDCRCLPVKSLDPLWEVVEETGVYCSMQGDSKLGQWCSDAALEIFGIDRERAMTIPLLRGGMFGFSLDHPVGVAAWNEYKRLCDAGAFNGAHYNRPGQPLHQFGDKAAGHVSTEAWVGGHRHDEAALSFIFWKLGLSPSHDLTNIDLPEISLIERNVSA